MLNEALDIASSFLGTDVPTKMNYVSQDKFYIPTLYKHVDYVALSVICRCKHCCYQQLIYMNTFNWTMACECPLCCLCHRYHFGWDNSDESHEGEPPSDSVAADSGWNRHSLLRPQSLLFMTRSNYGIHRSFTKKQISITNKNVRQWIVKTNSM